MRFRRLTALAGAAVLTAGVATAAATVASPATGGAAKASVESATCPWVGSHAPVATRVSELMARMTLADKLTMVDGASGEYVGQTAAIPSLCVPELTLEDGPAG